MPFLLQGFMLGLAYVMPIGMQNTYVINTAAQESKFRALQVGLLTALFDIALAWACFYGIGVFLDTYKMLRMIMLGVGTLAVFYIGSSLLRVAPKALQAEPMNKSILEMAAMVFVVTWLNPQAIIDGTMLLAGFKATMTAHSGRLFIVGVSLASATWFLTLGTLVNMYRKHMTPRVLRWINIFSGTVILLFGVKLAKLFIESYLVVKGV